MTFEQLLYVTELANQHSLQKTAMILHVSKSALSHAVTELEGELGLKLFDRTAKGSFLTPQGQELLPQMLTLLTNRSDLKLVAQSLAPNNQVEQLTFAYGNTLLKPFIDNYFKLRRQYHDRLTMTIVQKPVPRIIQAIRDHQIDFGFLAINQVNQNELNGLKFLPVHQGHLKLLMGKDNPLLAKSKLTLDDLKSQRFALFSDPYNDRIFAHLQYLCGPLPKILETDDGWAIYRAVHDLNCVGLARDWQAKWSSFDGIKTLPSRQIGNLTDDRFAIGWVTRQQAVTKPIQDYITMVNHDIAGK
ncbi:LysR family transcriptional regulator [Lactobacillus alvi]|uniref:LysR family transcriptional regulator n=1 Tax=Limosilactobacillus alvi TaxID=990412 RepID=A0ABS2EMB6_9LACO|nr:LysR family transcriptional regulator [Limosilactobacillus alvi]MBM6753632.1 LysR family transcriptional regulator [Limosilactobacillus alvi]